MKKLIVVALGWAVASASPSMAQSPGLDAITGRNYNLRRVYSSSGIFSGAKATYNNGASNLSVPTPNGGVNPAQASFNTWLLLNPRDNYPCYAELLVARRKWKAGTATSVQKGDYYGWIYAITQTNVAGNQVQTEYIQLVNGLPSSNTASGGLAVEITYSGNTLQGKRNGASVLTSNNFKCYQNTANGFFSVNPTGVYGVDYGFEGNTMASVWTNGASIGKMQQKIGNSAYTTLANPYQTITPGLPSWSNSYNPDDNLGTMIMFR
jgi:hypothetical protein